MQPCSAKTEAGRCGARQRPDLRFAGGGSSCARSGIAPRSGCIRGGGRRRTGVRTHRQCRMRLRAPVRSAIRPALPRPGWSSACPGGAELLRVARPSAHAGSVPEGDRPGSRCIRTRSGRIRGYQGPVASAGDVRARGRHGAALYRVARLRLRTLRSVQRRGGQAALPRRARVRVSAGPRAARDGVVCGPRFTVRGVVPCALAQREAGAYPLRHGRNSGRQVPGAGGSLPVRGVAGGRVRRA